MPIYHKQCVCVHVACHVLLNQQVVEYIQKKRTYTHKVPTPLINVEVSGRLYSVYFDTSDLGCAYINNTGQLVSVSSLNCLYMQLECI